MKVLGVHLTRSLSINENHFSHSWRTHPDIFSILHCTRLLAMSCLVLCQKFREQFICHTCLLMPLIISTRAAALSALTYTNCRSICLSCEYFFFFYAINCVCSVHRCLFYVKDERNDCSSQQSTFVRFFVGCELSTESGMRLTSCLMAEITNWLPLMSTADVNHRISTVKFLEGSMIREWWRQCFWANNLSGTPNGVTAVLCVCERQCSCSCIWQTVNVQRILAVIDGGVCLSSSYARNVYTQAIYPCFDMRMWKAYKWNTSHGCSCVFPTLTYAIHTA